MCVTSQLDDEHSRRLLEVARELEVDPSEFAKAAINDLVSRPADDFDRAAQRILEKNRQLYRRLDWERGDGHVPGTQRY